MARPKGAKSINRHALLLALKRRCGEHFDPIMEMAETYLELKEEAAAVKALHQDTPEEITYVAQALNNNTSHRITLLKEMTQYVYPKKKAVEVTGEDGQEIPISIVIDFGGH